MLSPSLLRSRTISHASKRISSRIPDAEDEDDSEESDTDSEEQLASPEHNGQSGWTRGSPNGAAREVQVYSPTPADTRMYYKSAYPRHLAQGSDGSIQFRPHGHVSHPYPLLVLRIWLRLLHI